MAQSSKRQELDFVKKHLIAGSGEEWHIIDSLWLKQWRKHASEGGPHPGPIRNWDLLDPETCYSYPKPSLKAEKHYAGISKLAWNYLHERYGGGPGITCRSLDIYRATVHEGAAVDFEDRNNTAPMGRARTMGKGRSEDSGSMTRLQTLKRVLPFFKKADSNKPRQIFGAEYADITTMEKEVEFVKTNDVAKEGEDWHIIDAEWLRRWRNYVQNDGAHPGSICNWQLLDPDTSYQTPKQHLTVGKHYRGVSATVWRFFDYKYGGGPNIAGREVNIYSATISGGEDESKRSWSKTTTSTDFSPTSSMSSFLSMRFAGSRMGRAATGHSSDTTTGKSPSCSRSISMTMQEQGEQDPSVPSKGQHVVFAEVEL